MKKWVFTAFQTSLSGPTLEPCRSAGREAVFCLRGGNRCPSGSCRLPAVMFFQTVCANHWQCGKKKILKSAWCFDHLICQKRNKTTTTTKPKVTPELKKKTKIPQQSHTTWESSTPTLLRLPTALCRPRPPWGCAAVRWLMEWEQDLRFHGRICYLACSFAVLVITSISDIVKVIWALPCYGLLALGGKTGKADEGSLWVLKWLCVCVLTPGRERHKCFSLLPST